MIQSPSTTRNTSPFRVLSRPVLAAAHRAIAVIALLLTLVIAAPVRAQCPGAWVQGIGAPGANSNITSLVVLPAGDVIVGGFFTAAGGVAPNRIARYSPTAGGGGVWTQLASGVDSGVFGLAVLPDGDAIVGGAFITAGGVSANRIARCNPTTGIWSALGTGTNGVVRALAVLPGGDVIVGGQFTTAGGVTVRNIARCNPATGVWSAMGSGTSATVYALAVLPGGDVIVGGEFSAAGSLAGTSKIARYNPTTGGGGVWSAIGTGVNNTVLALAVLPDGDVIAGGDFTTAGGVAASRIARVNPATGTWSALGSGTDSSVRTLAALPDGAMIVGGTFTTAGGVAASSIARVNPTTSDWSALGSGTDIGVNALAVLPGGDAIVGGEFLSAGGEAASRIARYFFGALAPVVTSQPRAVVTLSSNSAVFYCGASAGLGSVGAPTYQWRKDGVVLDTIANPSAVTLVLTLTNVQSADLGSYDCLVTNSCGGPGTLSNPATLTFVAPPVSPACSLADVAGALINGQPAPDGIVDGNDFIEFINAFAAGC